MESIRRSRVQELLDQGAQIAEVLGEREYRAAHLPGALHLPGPSLTREHALERLRPDRPVVVYCFDTL